MNGRDDEVWLDALLQRQLPATLSEDGFREQVLRRLPPHARLWLRVLILGLSWGVAGLSLLIPVGGEAMLIASTDAGSMAIPSILGAALLWYFADHLV